MSGGSAQSHHTASSGVAPAVTGTPADGVRDLKRLLDSAQIRRWPMYLRNVKQLLRQANPPFDERAYGFGSLVDLLRAAQKENLLRVDRDRQGVIRVFQGSAATMPPPHVETETEMTAETQPALVDSIPELVAAPPAEAVVEPEELPDDNIGNVAPDPTVPKARRRRSPPAPAASRAPRSRRPRKTA